MAEPGSQDCSIASAKSGAARRVPEAATALGIGHHLGMMKALVGSAAGQAEQSWEELGTTIPLCDCGRDRSEVIRVMRRQGRTVRVLGALKNPYRILQGMRFPSWDIAIVLTIICLYHPASEEMVYLSICLHLKGQ